MLSSLFLAASVWFWGTHVPIFVEKLDNYLLSSFELMEPCNLRGRFSSMHLGRNEKVDGGSFLYALAAGISCESDLDASAIIYGL